MGHPQLDLGNKTAVVIGGTSGIGLAIAKGLAVAGADVVATGRRGELVRAVTEEIEARAAGADAYITKMAAAGSLVEAMRALVTTSSA